MVLLSLIVVIADQLRVWLSNENHFSFFATICYCRLLHELLLSVLHIRLTVVSISDSLVGSLIAILPLFYVD